MGVILLKFYRVIVMLIEPLLALWLGLRVWRGKEDKKRLAERFGFASLARPKGMLMWLHAASVGEANSVLALIGDIRKNFPQLSVLLTTGTVTSARLMESRLPTGAFHQYVPLDTGEATRRFMHFLRPEFAFFVESELWPNLIIAADEYQCFLGLINGRMSARSFAGWKKHPGMIGNLLSRFNIVFAQSEADGARFKALGASRVECLGNIKYDALALSCNESELLALKKTIGARPLWLAASTHPGEEIMAAKAHALLAGTRPNLLTIIVPRHPARGAEIAKQLSRFGKTALRSQKQIIAANTAFYIADTMGELGLFYRLSEIVFMGGSLISHGGQNPLEPARLSCAILAGPHTHNFSEIYGEMEQEGACVRIEKPAALAPALDRMLNAPSEKARLGQNAKRWVDGKSGATRLLLEKLTPMLSAL